MNSLLEMMDMVRERLHQAGFGIVNEHRIHVGNGAMGLFHTESGYFLVKWNVEFKHAGSLIKNLNGGKPAPGQTIPTEVYNNMMYKQPTILFNTAKDNIIYAIDFDEFTRLSEPYIQNGGEEVRVILSKSLLPWSPEMPYDDQGQSLDNWTK